VKFATNIHRMSGRCWKGFQGQRSKVKVMTKSNAVMWESCIPTMWRPLEVHLWPVSY